MLTNRSGLLNSFGTEKELAWPAEGPGGGEGMRKICLMGVYYSFMRGIGQPMFPYTIV